MKGSAQTGCNAKKQRKKGGRKTQFFQGFSPLLEAINWLEKEGLFPFISDRRAPLLVKEEGSCCGSGRKKEKGGLFS